MSGEPETLFDAVRNGAPEEVRALLISGAPVNRTDRDGHTPLHLAIARSDEALTAYRITGMLLAAGADPNARGSHGGTPLHAAAARGDERLIAMLLDRGADPTLTLYGEDALTAELLAREAGHGAQADFIATYTRRDA